MSNLVRHYFFLVIILFLLPLTLPAQVATEDISQLTLERIYSSNEFQAEGIGSLKWLEDGTGFTRVEPAPNGQGLQIVQYLLPGGKRSVVVTADQLTPHGRETSLEVQDYTWSPDKNKLLIFTNTERVWRYNTRGDYWILNMNNDGLHKLGGEEAEPSTLMFAKFAPVGNRVAYVREHNIYVEHLVSGQITQLTHDGSEDIINGTFDWAYEEEFQIRDGFRWSPDGRSIAYWRLDASGIRDFLMINNTDSLYSYTIPVEYPKVGTKPSECKIRVVPVSSGETT
jgi:dipeptidyl-peptidase-4